jgi:D-alanine-D-alanine ligase
MRRYPMIVKPAYEDASGGIDAGSIVHDRKALEARVKKVVEEYRMPALVEEYIEGREIHCAVLGNPPVALPLFEMEFKEMLGEDGKALPRIITHRAKWDPFSRDYYAVEAKCPADELEPEVVEKIKAAAIKACRAVGTRDYARVDMRVDAETGDPYVLEVNPNPDLAPNCAFAQCVRASGRTYNQAVVEIVEAALERGKGVVRPPAAQDVLLNEYVAKKRGVVK